jgi:hypothetical protein
VLIRSDSNQGRKLVEERFHPDIIFGVPEKKCKIEEKSYRIHKHACLPNCPQPILTLFAHSHTTTAALCLSIDNNTDLTMRWFLRSALLLLALSATTVAASKVGDNARDQQLQDIIYWVRSEGGFFNNKLEIRRADPADPTSYYGIFAKETIQLNERIMTIESSSMMRHELGSYFDDKEESFQVLCGLTQRLLKELRLGVKSMYAPYINYILGEEYGQIPATWSETGKAMLREIIDQGEEGWDMTDWITNGFEGKCIKEGNAFEIQALALAAQRGYHNLLIPLYDMANRSNDKEAINMENTSIDLDVMRVSASREIPAGQELLTTYDGYTRCGSVADYWGTQAILCNYGFVEPYPRKFKLGMDDEYLLEGFGGGQDLLLSVHENKQTKKLEVTWVNEEIESPDAEDIDWMKQYRRILEGRLHGGTLESKRNEIPKREWNVIFEYLEAILTAVDSAIETVMYDLEKYDLDPANYEGECDKDGNCSAPWMSYADLDEPIEVDEEKEYLFIYQSETLIYGIDHFDHTGNSDSHYQSMDYWMEPRTKEMCFHIDTVFQMCSSYRPHYHEMGVHLPARYLVDSLKRVLWIGGGDAMFLHEILKYPDLELAVGLELDQKVTRGAFQYFGVQPHFDNEKVQWWFGDASKSLLMLPKDYFGSFDMVLVDLSDTVLSLSVTKEMDIIGALSLLLKPDGIFVMNEMVR